MKVSLKRSTGKNLPRLVHVAASFSRCAILLRRIRKRNKTHEKSDGTGDRTGGSVIGDTRSPGFVRAGVRIPRRWNGLTSRTHHRTGAKRHPPRRVLRRPPSPNPPPHHQHIAARSRRASRHRWRERDVTGTHPSSCLRHPPMSETSLLPPRTLPKIQMSSAAAN